MEESLNLILSLSFCRSQTLALLQLQKQHQQHIRARCVPVGGTGGKESRTADALLQ